MVSHFSIRECTIPGLVGFPMSLSFGLNLCRSDLGMVSDFTGGLTA